MWTLGVVTRYENGQNPSASALDPETVSETVTDVSHGRVRITYSS